METKKLNWIIDPNQNDVDKDFKCDCRYIHKSNGTSYKLRFVIYPDTPKGKIKCYFTKFWKSEKKEYISDFDLTFCRSVFETFIDSDGEYYFPIDSKSEKYEDTKEILEAMFATKIIFNKQ